jgi:two-component system chemotaxis response regulator CheY
MSIQSARILVVDDQFGNRDSLETFLQGQGYITESAGTGEHALRLVAQRAPDLILLDITMPEMDGLETLKQIKAFDPNATIIMVTAIGTAESVKEAIKLGAKGYIVKPLDREKVIERIGQILK